MSHSPASPTSQPPIGQLVLLISAMVLPALAALFYFLYLDSSAAAPWAYAASKAVQFSLPLLALPLASLRLTPRWSAARCLVWGVVSGTAAGGVLWLVYGQLLDAGLRGDLANEVAAKTADFGVGTPLRYLLLTLFLSLAHSALEEYYWRWYVFGALDRWLARPLAVLLSSLCFMAHHVVILSRFLLPSGEIGLLVLACAGVAVGGAVWAWLYARGGRLLTPWVSHVLADVWVMLVGFDLLRGSW